MALTLEEIRRQLREKFPQAHGLASVPEVFGEDRGDLFRMDVFPAGSVSEVVPADEGGGLSLWLAGLLDEDGETPGLPKLVLVDGGDGFDPASYPAAACARLLWVRCRAVPEALKTADLLVRDGNVPFVVLDLCRLPVTDLRSIPAAAWWRLKQCCEAAGCRLVVMSPFPLVPCAQLRLALSARLALSDFELPRREVLERLRVKPERVRRAT